MKSSKRSKSESLRSAAIVKMKYEMNVGQLDDGFLEVFKGVLADLSLSAKEVDRFIQEHQDELQKACLDDR